VGFVWNGREDRSEVWVIDAQHLADGPVARVILPQRVPNGFHSTWVRQSFLDGRRPAGAA
jgi:carotenoid cleavage dioxygenase